METGTHQMTSAAYHADPCPLPSLSSSIAKVLVNQSPLHAWMQHPRLNPKYQPEESSRFDIGTAAHAMLLERDASKIVVVDAADWRTKAAQQARDAARAEGRLPILAAHHGDLVAMVSEAREAIDRTELAGILTDGLPEQTLIWRDSGVWCRARLDWLKADRTVILDYKTADNAAPEAFIRQIARMGYDMQAEFYRRGLRAATGSDAVFVFLAQETEAPYACSLVSLSAAYQEVAQARIATAVHTWGECLETGEWPGYSTQIHYAEPPTWMLADYASGEL